MEIDERDLIQIVGWRVHSLHFDERFVPYFEIISGEEIRKIRVHHAATEVMEWIEAHQDVSLDLILFPYKWEFGGRSGTIYRFRNAKVSSNQESTI